jgi:DNA helicase-2/ATP-dependent DNA helicase PcrA
LDTQTIIEGLNPEQKKAVENYNGPGLIIAGAGSGKTRVLTSRIAYLISQGISPVNILALTFTNKAANEMRERIAGMIGENTARYLNMGTFHSIFAKILRMEAEKLNYTSSFTIYDSPDSKNLIRTIIKDLKLDKETYKPGAVLGRISKAKNNLITPKAYKNNKDLLENDKIAKQPFIFRIYEQYALRCKQANAMDFDDLLLNINILFRDFPDVAEKYQNRFQYILVDEYQDTNISQYLILKKLSQKHKNLTVVGDDAQSIYAFRGAKIENILNFRNDYPNYKLFKLEQNYRSTKNIVNAANSIIKKNINQIQKNVFSEKDAGSKIKIIKANTDVEEGYKVVSEIFDLEYNKSYKHSDFAILYRTNQQSRIFEEALRKRNIPYKIYGGTSFYQRKEIKDIISYLRLIINPDDNEALKRIINYPKRGIGNTTIEKLETLATSQNTSIWKIITKLPETNPGLNTATINKILLFATFITEMSLKNNELDASEITQKIATESGILKDLYKDKSPEGVSRYENIKELLNGVKEFVEQTQHEQEIDRVPLSLYLENVALITDLDENDKDKTDKISLMTIHAAKGLEFKNVFIVGVEEELFPSFMSISSQKDLEEERRLFYVALTRAEENAFISYSLSRRKWGKFSISNPSRFISEINPEFIDNPGSNKFTSFEKTKQQESIYDNFNQKTSGFSNFKKKNTNFGSFGNKKTTAFKNFKSDDGKNITTGMQVEHARFGIGKVLAVEGLWPDTKALVDFDKAGKRNLLLKFAKLKIIE